MKARTTISRGKRSAAPEDQILVRHCHGVDEFEACIAVERAVWRSADIDVVPVPIFAVAAESGGQVLGAFSGNEIVGFTLAIAGWRERKPFLHSHMTAVLDGFQNRGIARRLKTFQREDALSRGIFRVEWTFDPLLRKNARFNFMKLGAVARRYLPNLYGITTSPLHAALPTDRLLVEWDLRSARVRQALAGKPPRMPQSKNAVRISVPPFLEETKQTDRSRAAAMQAIVRDEFMQAFAQGYFVTAVENPSPAESSSSPMHYILEHSARHT